MKKIKFIGSGRVIQCLLSDYREALKNFDLEFYSKKPRFINKDFELKHITSFTFTNDVIILCSSVCERTLLKSGASKSRKVVFEANIDHINEYIKQGCFNNGQVFVLTNPSELIAEYIFKKSSNKNIFALGQEVDIRRYRKILDTDRKVKCLGQHYQYPIIQKLNNNLDQSEVREKLIRQIQEEFINDSPPFESGAFNIIQLLKSFSTNSRTMVSSFCAINDSFLCGSLKISTGVFRVTNLQQSMKNSLLRDK